MAEEIKKEEVKKESWQTYRARPDQVRKHMGNGWIKPKQGQIPVAQTVGFEWDGSQYVDRGGMVLLAIPVKEYDVKKSEKEKVTEERMKAIEKKNKALGLNKENK